MKKLFIIATLLVTAFTTFAQGPNWQEFKKESAIAATQAAKQTNLELGLNHARLDTFNSEYKEAESDLDTLIVDFHVLNISGDTAQIMTSNRHYKYRVSIIPMLNPFGYTLQPDRQYTIALERNKQDVYEFQTRGQTRTLEARIIWFTVSEAQLRKDRLWLTRFIQEEPGYDRSPRNGH
ncbi:hypothetical protein ACNKXS_03415 [Christiangramia marina]|uniref:hypothetical protein n=1 Tax=Christiangramia marina TaxID=409436 RepID=UPI003AA854D2